MKRDRLEELEFKMISPGKSRDGGIAMTGYGKQRKEEHWSIQKEVLKVRREAYANFFSFNCRNDFF